MRLSAHLLSLALLSCVVSAVDVAQAQTIPPTEPRVHSYLELGGTSFLLGVRVARDQERYGGSIGIAPIPELFSGGLSGVVLSAMAHGFVADGRLELGIGPMGVLEFDDGLGVIGAGYVGVRRMPSDSGVTFRIGTALFVTSDGVQLWPSVSLGYAH